MPESLQPDATPPTAPPTAPGPILARHTARANRPAVASIVCGFLGFVLPGASIAAIVLGIIALVQIKRRRPKESGTAFAIIGIVSGPIGVGAWVVYGIVYVSIADVAQQTRALLGPAPARVQRECRLHAEQNGAYPDHVAELMLGQGTALPPMVASPAALAASGTLVVGEYDATGFAYTATAGDALRDALATVDTSEPVYPFGECWFVRLGQPRDRNDLVAVWAVAPNGAVLIAFDDGGDLRDVTEEKWNEIWEADAAARRALGLRALEGPEYPAPN